MLSSIGEGGQTSRRVRVALGLIVADIAKTQVLTEADASGYTTFRAYERATQKIVYRAWRYESEGTGWSFAKTHDWAVMQDDMRNTMRAGYAGAVASALKALGAEAELPYSGGGREIEAMTNEDSLRLVGFFSFIRENSKEEGGKWSTVKARLRIWQLRWKEIKSMAMAFAAKAMKGKEKLLTWIFGPTLEHCVDCTGYRGHTYPASMWAAVGALPQSRNLACRGFRCECRLIPSKGPISSGEPRPPRYSLGGRLSLF